MVHYVLSLLRSEAEMQMGYFYYPLDGMLVHRWVTPSIKFAGTHLCTEVERGTVRIKGLAQEHNTMSPDWVQTWATLIMRPPCLLHLRYKAGLKSDGL